jgi:pyruvate formate lyase activating enzyme
MKGGLTVSGGEPLVQDRFVVRLFRAVRETGIHTALDTNGYLGARLTDRDLETCDLVILGLKALDAGLHRRVTGMDNVPIIAFARRLAARGRPLWLRWVLVPGLTDDPGEVARIAEFAAGLGNVEQVEVVAFHQLGRFKWEAMGLPYECRNAVPPSTEQLEQAMRAFRAAGLDVH